MRQRKIWLLSGTHFSHDKLVNDGLRPKGFEKKIVDNCKRVIEDGDILIHLGDVSFYNNAYWQDWFCSEVPGTKWLIKGNHDHESVFWYMRRGWAAVADTLTLDIYGKRVLFSHRPAAGKGDFDACVHGHLHNCTHRPADDQVWNYLIQIEDTLAPVALQSIASRWLV